MLKLSTGFTAAIFGPQSFDQIFNGGSIRLYGGARPASANASADESQLIAIAQTVSGLPLQYQVLNGMVSIPPGAAWQFQAVNPGTATWFRLLGASDSHSASLTDPRIDGDVGITSAPNDLTLQTQIFAAGTAVSLDSFLFTLNPQ